MPTIPTSVSVVVPAYNATGVIGIALDALLGQQDPPPDYEILVVDDASTDATASIVEGYAARAPGAGHRTAPHPPAAQCRARAAARNRGAAEAKGDVIVFTDSDCEPTPRWLAEMLAPFADSDMRR